MGAEVLAVAAVGMGVAQGVTSMSAYNEQAGLYEKDARLMEREAMREATRVEDEGRRFADEQKMAYIGSGVEIGGSAVVTLAQTDKWAKAEAESVRERGRAAYDYQMRAAKLARRQGMAGFLGGIMSGVTQAAGLYSATKMPAGYKGENTGTGTVKQSTRSAVRYGGKSGYGSGASAYKTLGVS